MSTPTAAQKTALAHMRDRYPELTNHTDSTLEAFEALTRVAAQTQHDPRSVDRTTQEHALRLVDLAKQGTKFATLTLLAEAQARGLDPHQTAEQTGYAGPTQVDQRMKRLRSHLGVREIDFPVGPDLPQALKASRRHLKHTIPPALLQMAVPLFAVWLLHRPRPDLHTWLQDPTPHSDNPDTATIVNQHALLPPGTRADLTNLILASHTTAKDPHP